MAVHCFFLGGRTQPMEIIPRGQMPLGKRTGSCHVLQWASKFTRKLVRSRRRGEVYALSGMVDRAALLSKFYVPLTDFLPDEAGVEDCGNLCT